MNKKICLKFPEIELISLPRNNVLKTEVSINSESIEENNILEHKLTNKEKNQPKILDKFILSDQEGKKIMSPHTTILRDALELNNLKNKSSHNIINNEAKFELPVSQRIKSEVNETNIDFECITIKQEPAEDLLDESAASLKIGQNVNSIPNQTKPYSCSHCSKGFDLKISLEKHELTHAELITCEECNLTFSNKGELNQHNLKNHNSNGSIHTCFECGRAFPFKSSYLAHVVCHTTERSHICDVCSKEFKHKYSLLKHKLTHTGIKPHVCKICSKGFTLSGNLIQHMRTHTAEKPYVCGLCSKKFGSEPELNKHFNKHRGQQSYACEFCAKPFSWRSDLIRHRRTHTGDKPYVCSICNKGFSQKQNLANHELIHLGLKPNECEVCQKSFSAKSALTAHMWSKHQIFIDKKAFKKVQSNNISSNPGDSILNS